MNFARVYEENGGLLSVNNLYGGPYWKIRFCSFHMMGSAAFEDVW